MKGGDDVIKLCNIVHDTVPVILVTVPLKVWPLRDKRKNTGTVADKKSSRSIVFSVQTPSYHFHFVSILLMSKAYI